MGFGLIDLLFAIGCLTVGFLLGVPLAHSIAGDLPRSTLRYVVFLTIGASGLGTYLALVCPFYRWLRLRPMVLPRCPCCQHFQSGYQIGAVAWPRITFCCPTCNGEFVIWHSGIVGDTEVWESPVLVLKWPYACGIYKRVEKPATSDNCCIVVPKFR